MSAFQQIWRCVICTFDNLPSSNQCEICDTARPVNQPQTPDPMDIDFEYAKQLHAQFNAEIQQSNDIIDTDLEYAKRLQAQFNKDDNESHQQPIQQITNKKQKNANIRKLSRNTSTYWNITGRKTNNSRKRMLEDNDSHSITPPAKQRKIISDLEYAKNLQTKFDNEINNSNKKIKHKKPKTYFGTNKNKNKNKNPIVSFPKILPNNYLGDPNIALNILNEYKGLQHDEFKEYNTNIPQLKVELKDYQKRGVSWMLNTEENGNKFGISGGLLCDEMGLGKTVQTIALMLIQKAKHNAIGEKDRTIIITPMSLIDQWISELNHICDPTAFKILNYYGNERALLRKHDFESCDVVLSTVQTFCNITNFQTIGKLKKGFFNRMVIDEMHEVGNGIRTRFYTQFCESKGIKYRWALTGTPINNDLPVDLSGMCRFIGIKYNIYCNQLLLLPIKQHKMNLNDEICVNKIKEFMGTIMLRRTKNQVLANNFPEKREEIIRFNLNEEEQIVYNRFALEIQEKYLNTRSYVIIHSLLLKLRKLCNHSSLVFNSDIIINDFNTKNNVLNEDVLERISSGIIRRINSMESILNIECPVCFEITELNGGIISNCGHLFCLECLNECVQQKNECALCRGICDENHIINIKNVLNSKYINEKHKYEFNQWKQENKNIIKNLGNNIVNKVCVFDQKYKRLIQKYSQISMASTKINLLIKKLKYIQINHKGDKVIIFSNFSQSFNVISERLEKENIKHLQFHSKLRRGQRKEVLNEFKNKKKGFFGKNVLLISAKCASVGLNLMCSNHVIFLDPRWNPALDNQAIGRCWRLGQNKTVYVTRLITNDTIEEKILSLMQDKNEKKYKNMTNLKRKAKLTERDYDMLFGYDRSDNTNNR